MYDKIVINKIPLKPNSPKESRSERNFDEINPNPIIENKLLDNLNIVPAESSFQ